MSPQVNLSNQLYAKLQSVAVPFVDTPETAIEKALDFYINKKGSSDANAQSLVQNDIEMKVDPDNPPDLSFTRPMAIEVEGMSLSKGDLYWNPLMYKIIAMAAAKLGNTDDLKKILLCNYMDGPGKPGTGYHLVPGTKLSVQGQAANPAWKTIAHVAKKMGFTLDVTFVWESNPKAAYPGKTATMSVGK